MTRAPTDIPASVHARLLQRAKAEGRPFEELLQYFAMERLLYRLSRSPHADRFVLKGALMLQFWGGPRTRATQDIDLHGRSTLSVDELVAVVRDCLMVQVEEDGLRFDPGAVIGEPIRVAAHYHGVRARCKANLGNARVSLQMDVGFGDVITPRAVPIEYPTLLDFAAPHLLGYTPETVIAEKFEAMVVLDMANSRLKDFLDIWTLAQGLELDGSVLAQAIGATFERRRTPLPTSTPTALTPRFFLDGAKQAQWLGYVRKARVRGTVPRLEEVALQIDAFITPVVAALVARATFELHWPAGGPWFAATSDGKKPTP